MSDEALLDRFLRHHQENPGVYTLLVELAEQARSNGFNAIGIKALGEIARWEHASRTGADDFKVNNSYLSFYSRLIARDRPDLASLFRFRTQRGSTISVPPEPTHAVDDDGQFRITA